MDKTHVMHKRLIGMTALVFGLLALFAIAKMQGCRGAGQATNQCEPNLPEHEAREPRDSRHVPLIQDSSIGIETDTEARELSVAREKGALAMITAKVVDENGNPVPFADVDFFFYVLDKGPKKVSGKTNQDGLFSASANATWDVRCFVRKDGYHEGQCRYYLQNSPSRPLVSNGRWQPWNPVVDITLLHKGENASFIKKDALDVVLPETERYFGYDFDVGDLVEPFGKGKQSQLLFRFVPGTSGRELDASLDMVFDGEGSGFVIGTRRHDSASQLPRRAPDSGYCRETNLTHRLPGPLRWKEVEWDMSERFFLFKVNDRLPDGESGLLRFRYGFMNVLGFDCNERTIRLWHGITTRPDDQNLEGFE